MSNRINVSVLSNERFIVIKMQYKEHLVQLYRRVKNNNIKFPFGLMIKAYYKLFSKRYASYKESFLENLSQSSLNMWL